MFSFTPYKKKKRKPSTTIYVRLQLFSCFSVSLFIPSSLCLYLDGGVKNEPILPSAYFFFLKCAPGYLSVCASFSLSLSFLASISVGLFLLNTPASCETRVPPHNKPDVSPQLVLLSIREKI